MKCSVNDVNLCQPKTKKNPSKINIYIYIYLDTVVWKIVPLLDIGTLIQVHILTLSIFDTKLEKLTRSYISAAVSYADSGASNEVLSRRCGQGNHGASDCQVPCICCQLAQLVRTEGSELRSWRYLKSLQNRELRSYPPGFQAHLSQYYRMNLKIKSNPKIKKHI